MWLIYLHKLDIDKTWFFYITYLLGNVHLSIWAMGPNKYLSENSVHHKIYIKS